MIRENTGGRSWDENENAHIQLLNGKLIITQSIAVHSQIRRLLNLLQQFK